jgi:FSR family fosmidomycin resistance protein-like MFS transporter
MAALDVSLALAGLLIACYQVTSSLVQPYLGHLADRTAVRWFAWAGVATSAVAASLLGIAPSYPALLLLVLVNGLGTAMFHPPSAAMVSGASARLRGRLMSVYITAGNVGLALGPLLLAPLLARFGPSGSVYLAPLGVLAGALVFRYAPRLRPRGGSGGSFWSVLTRHRQIVGRLLGIVVLRAAAFSAIGGFLPVLLVERGQPPEVGAVALAAFLAAGSAGGLAGGFLADRFGRDVLIQLSLFLAVPAGLLVLHGGESLFWPALLLAGFFLNGSLIILTVRAQESVPGSVAMMSGLMLGLTIGLGGLAAAALAFAAERVGLSAALTVATLLPLGAAAVALTLPRRDGTPPLPEREPTPRSPEAA